MDNNPNGSETSKSNYTIAIIAITGLLVAIYVTAPFFYSWGAKTGDNFWIKLFSVIFLSSFMPLTAYSFYSYCLPRKGKDYKHLIEALGLQSAGANALLTTVDEEYSLRDYIFPVSFATMLCILWSVALLFGTDLKLIEQQHFLLSGVHALYVDGNLTPETIAYQEISLLVMLLSLLGAYIWSLQNLLVRLTTIDLPPSTYFSVAIRMLLATFVALMVRFIWLDPVNDSNITKPLSSSILSYDVLLVFAFLTGMFPERAIQYLKEKIPVFSGKKDKKSDDLPLSMIEGINMYHKVRLAEMGIDNAQNLAEANLVEILVRTPFKPKRVIDWMAQAKLYVYFKSDIDELRKLGIRTIFDFKTVAKDENKRIKIADNSELSVIQLSNVYEQIASDVMLEKLQNACSQINVI